jgi:hypothetical protein
MPEVEKPTTKVVEAVRHRYSRGAKDIQDDLCCPTTYDPKYLEGIPEEVLARDYGCGDPSRYLRAGDSAEPGFGAGRCVYRGHLSRSV